jgi:hypothetical protein
MYYLPGEGSYSIPYCHADGVNGFHPNEINNGTPYTQANFDDFAAVPSSMMLEVTHTVDVATQTVDVDVNITPLADYPSNTLKLHIAIVENTTYLNVGSNGQTEFHHVMKKMVPDISGTEVGPFTRGTVVNVQESWTFKGEYTSETGYGDPVNHAVEHTVEEFEDLSVIVFVQDDETWMVHQSEMSDIYADSE